MNPIEKMVRDLVGKTHEDDRTQEGIESSLLLHIAKDGGISGCGTFPEAYQKVVTRKIMRPEFANALKEITAAVMEMFPIGVGQCPDAKPAEQKTDPNTLN